MRYLVFVLFFVVSVGFGQEPEFTSGYEIFARVTECRESIKDDFIPEEFEEAIGMFSFEEDTSASLISIKGNFSGWEKEYWLKVGDVETNQIGHFIQIIFPIMNTKTGEIGMFSFIKGPFDFAEHYHQDFGMPSEGLKFEATILLATKRHTYIGIY